MKKLTTPNMFDGAEVECRALKYKGNEQAWQCVGGSWDTNDAGDMLAEGRGLAVNTEQAYDDCVVTGKWQFRYAGGASPQLIIRSLDSRRFYSVLFNFQCSIGVATWWKHPSVEGVSGWQGHLMTSIWKGGADGYQRMLGYRRKVGLYMSGTHPYQWYDVRVECVGPEILVFFDDSFVCAIRDEEYKAGLVGVASLGGKSAWKDLVVEGQAATLQAPWSAVEEPSRESLPDLPELTLSLTGARYLPSLDEWWKTSTEHDPDVAWVDTGKNFDELNYNNFWPALSRSKDGGKTWSEKERMNVPFPSGRAYQPIPGKAGGILGVSDNFAELSDGAIGCTGMWRNNPDGNYHSDQVQFLRSTDGGQTWSVNPVDATEWQRNESSWVELADGELLCLMRSNYECYVGVSRSRDKGRTWSRVRPDIPFFSASAPSLFLTSDNILILAVRIWGLFTSVDNGHTWSLPTDIGSYTGGGWEAQILQMPDGRILVGGPESGEYQLIRVDREGVIHPGR